MAALVVAGCGGGGGSNEPTSPANQAPTVSIDTPAANATFTTADTVTLTATATDADGSVVRVEFLSDGGPLGSSTTRPFTFNWTNPPLGTHTLTVRAIDNAGAGSLSGSRQITVSAPPNQPPTVSIDTPAANASFLTTDTVILAATASDADGSVVRVEFLDGGAKLGESTTRPFSFAWTNPPAGTHTLSVRAIDNTGAATVSGSRQITVSAPNQAPVVSMTAPANNFKANAQTAVLLTATASDSDGSVAKVEFFKINPAAPVFDATTLIGQANPVGTPPSYQLTTSPLAAGIYNFAARATDNKGTTANSGSVQVIMNALPVVSITAPTAGATIIPGTNYTLRATASDSDGSISKVEFFLNGSTTAMPGTVTRVGTTNEYTLAWTAVTGAVAFTARATDNDGAQTASPSVAANVPPNVLPSVTLDNPTAGTNAPTNLTLSASASDGDGSVTGVEFAYTLNGVTKQATGTLAAGKWTATVPVGASQFGTYAVTATATDNLGGKTPSGSKSITIAANVPPVVNITSPAAVTLDAGNANKDITLTATASDTDGITKVEFFEGATKIGEDTTAPYSIVLPGKGAGSYTITAKATDAVGSTATSAPQTLVVAKNLEGMWDTLSDAQKGGFNKNGLALAPDRKIDSPSLNAVGDDATVAGAVMTAIGPNTESPKFLVPMAQALRLVADLQIDTAGLNRACANGGTYSVFPVNPPDEASASAENGIDLNDCKIGGFTLHGGVDNPLTQVYTIDGPDNQCIVNGVRVPPSVPPAPPTVCTWPSRIRYYRLNADGSHYRVVFETVQISGNGVTEPRSEPFPHNAVGFAYLDCWGTGASKSCMTNLEGSFVWGADLAWTEWTAGAMTFPPADWRLYATDDTYKINGTLRPCQSDATPDHKVPMDTYCLTQGPAGDYAAAGRINFHIKYDNMTPNSGRAIVYGSDGWSVVTRLPRLSDVLPIIERVRVQSTVNGVQGPSRVFACPVDSNGFINCVLE